MEGSQETVQYAQELGKEVWLHGKEGVGPLSHRKGSNGEGCGFNVAILALVLLALMTMSFSLDKG